MFCRLEALPTAAPCVSIIVAVECDLSSLRVTLRSIALQTVMPLDVTLAVQPGDIEDCRAMAKAMLPPGLATNVVVHDRDGDGSAMIARLIDDGAGAAVAIIADGDVLAPDFLAAVLARFDAADGEGIAAVGIRIPIEAGSGDGNADEGELLMADILRPAEPRASCFVYRREAIERVGGWPSDLPVVAAHWDLHLRLALEWRISLLPAHLVARRPVTSARLRSGIAAECSTRLPHLLRKHPGQLRLLLSLAQESVSRKEREGELRYRIDQLSRRVEDLALMLARQVGGSDRSAARAYEGARAGRPA